MNVRFWVDEGSLESFIEFNIRNFNEPMDFKNALALITMVAADYDLDPEMDEETMIDIIKKTQEHEKETFVFSFHEEGIEVDI